LKLVLGDQIGTIQLKTVDVWRNRWLQLFHISPTVTRFRATARLNKGASPNVLVSLSGAAGEDSPLRLKLIPSCATEVYLFRDCSWWYTQADGVLKIVMISNPIMKGTLSHRRLYGMVD